jgi:hypothetical protein
MNMAAGNFDSIFNSLVGAASRQISVNGGAD